MTIQEAEEIVMAYEVGVYKGTRGELAMAVLMVNSPENPANMEQDPTGIERKQQ